MARESAKMTVRLSPEIVDVLRELADESGSTMTEVIKRSISDRKYFVDKINEGNDIILENGDTRTIVELR